MKIAIILALAVLGWFAMMALLASLPRLLDIPRKKRIRQYLGSIGCTNIEIRPWPNHYGVHFDRDGIRQYARCRVDPKGIITWVGTIPAGLDS